MKIGIAGLGRMGRAMAKRLLEVGHEVIVWNRTPGRADALIEAGAVAAVSPRDLAERAEAILTILTDAAAISDVYESKAGLLEASVIGKLFIEMSTVQPKTEIALAEKVIVRKATFLECPVGGTIGPALNGKLLGLVGGEVEDFARARPLLDQLCRRVDLVGPVGSGASMKLAINLPLAVFWQSFGEAFSLCRHLDLERDFLVELFAETSGAPNVLRARGGAVAKALQSKDPESATFDCDSVRKDLRTMVAEAKERGFNLPLVEKTLDVYDQASREGWGNKDCVELPAFWSSHHSY